MQHAGIDAITSLEFMTDLKSLELHELQEELRTAGYPAFRARQLYEWMHVKCVRSYEEMTNIPRAMREDLAARYTMSGIRLVDRQISKIDGTQKFLFALNDGSLVESVLMEYKYGASVCISSQVGCRMGCRFCASTLDGLIRGLLPAEMLEQIYEIHRITGERISHVVVMGTGEPLDNYDNLIHFLHMLTDANGQNLSMRNVTVSTCGIVPRILDLAKENLSITLALSLHATTDDKRREIMPIANRYSIGELMRACRSYFDQTGRRVTFEYTVLKGVNDGQEDARLLGGLARQVGAHVNLIAVNPVKERAYERPEAEDMQAFRARLAKYGINVSIRRALGRDIDGACGQLRHRNLASTGAAMEQQPCAERGIAQNQE